VSGRRRVSFSGAHATEWERDDDVLLRYWLALLGVMVLAPSLLLAQGTFSTQGGVGSAAPGGDNSCNVSVAASGAGALTVAEIKIDGVVLDSSHYTVTNNGSSTPDIVFHTGYVPAKDAVVLVTGTTAGGDGEYRAKITW